MSGRASDPAPERPAVLQPKLVYLARRNPALSREAFVVRWRQHGALGMSLPRWRNIARYVHGDVADPGDTATGLARGFDAVGLIWHRSQAARAAHLADTGSRAAMERDELETFAEPIVRTCMVVRETVLMASERSVSGNRKLVRFVRARDRDGAATLAGARIAAATALRDAMAAAAAPVRGHVVDEPLPPERAAGWGLAVDAIEELWFDDERAARRGAAALAARDTELDALTVLTNEVVLYEA